ncbi:biotin--[acetyl-CoA-carboxylase] ligase [candidate division KSB1 bacterium]|nr:biotin--[acetyl-CoA-carboxylase] ligase [candidate division KSB1 bacterium]
MTDFNILHFDQLDSTNTYAMAHLDTLQDRQIILSESQTAGYGRFKRIWNSDAPENIFMSIVLKPKLELNENCPIANLTQYMSLVLCDIFEQYDVHATIKWPNDVLMNDAKIAGLLSEASICDNHLKGIVLGAGVNLNMSADQIQRIDQPATALNLVTGIQIDKDDFLENLLEFFFEDYESLLKIGFPAIRERYIQRIPFLGKRITVNMQDRTKTGIAGGFTEIGCLILKTESEGEVIITAGDVIL